MYKVVNSDGSQSIPADTTQLFRWAREGRVFPHSILIDEEGSTLRADALPGLQTAFVAAGAPPSSQAVQSGQSPITASGLGSLLLMALVVIALIFIVGTCSKTATDAGDTQLQQANREAEQARKTQEAAKEKRRSAYYMSQQFVEDRLKSPKSADFPIFDESFVTDLGNNTFRVKAFVDSQNSFGAMMHADYKATIHDKGDGNWSLTEFDLRQRE